MGLQRHMGRATGLMVAGALGATLLGSSCLRAAADDDLAQSRRANALRNATIDLELADSPLPSAIRLVEQRTGASVVLIHGSDNYRYGAVTVSLKDRPIQDVLKQIAASAGADFWQDSGIYYIGPKGSAPKAAPDPTGIAPMPAVTPDLPEPREWIKIQLLNSEPHDIMRQLRVDNSLMGSWLEQFRDNALRMMLDSQDPKKQIWSQPITGPFQIQGGDKTAPNFVPASTGGLGAAPDLNSANVRSATGLPPLGTGGSAGDQGAHRDGDPQEFARGGQFGFGQGGQAGQGGQIGGQPGSGGQPGANGQNGAGAASGLLPPDIQPARDIIALPNDNSILLRIRPADEAAVRRVIRLLDIKPRQLMIKAEFVTVTQNDIDAFGINFQFQRVNLVGATNTGFAGTGGQAFLQYATGNLAAQLSVALSQGHGKLVAAPMATTLNNYPVTFSVQTTVPAFISTPVVTNGGTTVISQTIIPLPVTTGLAVLPRINGDDSITLFGYAIASAVGAPITGPNGESYPNITSQNAPIQRIIRNGDTMVIAGLNSKNDIVTSFKVPLVGDLPLIGNLFRSRSVTTNDSELLIFVTPTILPERVSNAALTGGAGPAPAGGGGALPAPGPTP